MRTFRSAGVISVLKGKVNAESEMKTLQTFQLSQDWLEGWRYFVERSCQKAGSDAAEATHARQAELESRESQAQLDADAVAAAARSTRR